jgi:hypothetical protein
MTTSPRAGAGPVSSSALSFCSSSPLSSRLEARRQSEHDDGGEHVEEDGEKIGTTHAEPIKKHHAGGETSQHGAQGVRPHILRPPLRWIFAPSSTDRFMQLFSPFVDFT